MRKHSVKLCRLLWMTVSALTLSAVLTACGLLLSEPIAQIGTEPLPPSVSTALPDRDNGETAETTVPPDPSEDIRPTDTELNGETSESTSHDGTVQAPSTEDPSMENTTSDIGITTFCPHMPTTIPSVPSTCLTSGKTEGSMCSTCGEVLLAQEEIPATGHSYCAELGYKCASCDTQAVCPIPVLNVEGDLALTRGEELTLSWQFANEPLFPAVCMVTAIDENGLPVDLWETWKPDMAYSRLFRQDGETVTLRVYACLAVNGDPISATRSRSADITVTVSVREALEAPGFITGNQITVNPGRDITVAWGAVYEAGSSVVYEVLLLSPDGEEQVLQTSCKETVCTVPASMLSSEGIYTLQVTARDKQELRRDSTPASLCIQVTPPLEVGEQDYSNPAYYASDYFYNYLATQDNGEGLRGFYRLMDVAISDFHKSTRTAETVQVSGGTVYHYAVKLDFTPFGLNREEAASVRMVYLLDHPLYYWVSNTYVYTDTTLYICVDSDYATGQSRARGNGLVYSGVESMAENVIGVESPYRIALTYYEKLLARADYAYEEDGTTPRDDLWAHSIIGVFDPNRSEVVCEGFAKAYSLLLNYHGVENIPVIGQSRGVGHMWNLLRLDDGEWYWCDITWDDKTHSPLGTDYKYFCVTDTQDVLYYYMRDGIEAGMNASFGDPATFLDDHAVLWNLGLTLDMSKALPSRAETPFDGDSLELRDTFTVDGLTYAKTGFGKVQLVDVGSRRSVTVPESVTYAGITYAVTSVGLINSEGVYVTGRMLPLFATSVYIPKTVTHIWDNALSGFLVSITVDPENPSYTSQNGFLMPKS